MLKAAMSNFVDSFPVSRERWESSVHVFFSDSVNEELGTWPKIAGVTGSQVSSCVAESLPTTLLVSMRQLAVMCYVKRILLGP